MKNRSIKEKSLIPYLFLIPSLAGVCAIMIIPYIDVFIRSFRNIGGSFTGLENYLEVFSNEAFQIAMKNTGKFMAVCIPLLLIISFIIAMLIYEIPKIGPFLKTGFLLPMVIPVASVVFVWKYFFAQTGFINGLLVDMGENPVNWMDSNAAFWILVGSYIWRNLGFNVILWLAALSTVDVSSYEAAKLDGAGFIKRHLYVTIPSIKGMSFVIVVLAMLNSFKVFREAYLVSGDYPHESIYMIQHLFNNWFRNLEMDKLAAASVIDAVIMMVFILILQHIWGRDEKEGEIR